LPGLACLLLGCLLLVLGLWYAKQTLFSAV